MVLAWRRKTSCFDCRSCRDLQGTGPRSGDHRDGALVLVEREVSRKDERRIEMAFKSLPSRWSRSDACRSGICSADGVNHAVVLVMCSSDTRRAPGTQKPAGQPREVSAVHAGVAGRARRRARLAQDAGEADGAVDWGVGVGGETLLNDLVRTASRDPDRLKPVRRLIDDLRKTEEGRRIVPDELFSIWTAVEEALAREPRS